MQYSDFVIVGGVAAGPKTAATLARRLPQATVTLFQKGKHLSYASCGLPWYASGDLPSLRELLATGYGVTRDAEFFRESRGFEAVTGTEVIDIDRGKKALTIRDLAAGTTYEHGYGNLVLATGAAPTPAPFPVASSDRIRRFHTPDDAVAFRAMAEKGQISRAVIVGSGFVGCELAEAVSSLWGIETVLLEREPQVLPGMLDPEMAALVERQLREHDIEVRTDATVTGIECEEPEKPTVVVHGCDAIQADYVFVALGLRPRVDLARNAELEIGSTGAIVVNGRMQTSDPDIYAGGDCVESIHQITGQQVHICLGSLANRHGRVIAENLAGNTTEFAGVLGSRILKVFDLNIGAVGLTEIDAENAGFATTVLWGTFGDKPDYQPDGKTFVLKMVYDPTDERLLGLEAVGEGDICRRLDVFSTFLHSKGTIADLFDFEHTYAPPYAEALDPLHHLAGMAMAQKRGIQFVSPAFHSDTDVATRPLVLDVREDEEATDRPLPSFVEESGCQLIQVPLGELRKRLDTIDRDRRIVIICQRGARSYQAAVILAAASFRRVDIVAGGLGALTDGSQSEVTKPQQTDTVRTAG